VQPTVNRRGARSNKRVQVNNELGGISTKRLIMLGTIVSVVIGHGKTVHRARLSEKGNLSVPLCGSGVHARKFCATSRSRIVESGVTCKKCTAAQHGVQPTAEVSEVENHSTSSPGKSKRGDEVSADAERKT
jgi:hypothetical protein